MHKLFWDNPYQTTCKAKVMHISGKNVKLDQSVFYAFSGGQESDEGTIGGIKVAEAIKEGDKEDIIDITYALASEPQFNLGDEVEVVIDNDRREKLRKLHSMAHIAYYFLREKLGGFKVLGSHVSAEKSRIDITSDEPLTEVLPSIESDINTFLKADHRIITEQDPQKPDLRWWKCGEWKMPCGGTHVKSTSEIGAIRLTRKSKGVGKERVEIWLV